MVALSKAQIGEAVYELLNAPGSGEARRIICASPWLTSSQVDARLTQVIAHKHQARDLPGVAVFTTCRGFLRRCRALGVSATLKIQANWPLSTQGALIQLLALDATVSPDLYIERANAVLGDVEPETESDLYGWLQYHLGLGYQAQADIGSSEALDLAMKHFESAVLTWDTQTSWLGEQFLGWALHNQGRLYLQRRHGNRSQDVETALRWLDRAYRASDAGSSERLDVLILLGNAYLDRISAERLENIERGIDYYEQARQLAEDKKHSKRLGEIEHNLAVAYRTRLHGRRADNYEQARRLAESALARLDQEASPEDWARTAVELASIYYQRRHGDPDSNLENAIAHARQALKIYRLETHPRQWMMVRIVLGNLYCDRISGIKTANERQAIHHYQTVLKHCDRRTDPLNWTDAMNNLGTVYASRSKCSSDMNYCRAIRCFRQALEVSQPTTLPSKALQAASNWGNLGFRLGDWTQASSAFQIALQAGQALYQASSTEAGRRVELAETSRLYVRAAYCLLKTKEAGQALLQLEQGKARLLAERLARDNLDLTRLSNSQQREMQGARGAVHALEAEMRLPPTTPSRRNDRELAHKLQLARADLDRLIQAVRAEHPDFMPTGLDLRGVLHHIPQGGALIAPLITSQGSAVFVLPDGTTKVGIEHVIPLKDFTNDDLNSILLGSENEPGWLRAYIAYLTEKRRAFEILHELKAKQTTSEREQAAQALQAAFEEWKTAIEAFNRKLWDALMGPVYERLTALGQARGAPVTLMPQGGLGLLPLHAAWRCCNGVKRAFLDDYTVTFTPSAYALSVSCRRLQEPRCRQPVLLAVVNPTADLLYAPVEVQEAAKLFAPPARQTLLVESQATRQAVINSAPECAYLHFACHGFYDWQDVMRSGLILADDAPLTLAEIISNIDLSTARLVVLSACETGLTEFQRSPDEYIGLPAGFLQAGAPGVISTLWAVEDISTALLIGRFYRCHLKGDPERPTEGPLAPAQALCRAQRWLRDKVTAKMAAQFCLQRVQAPQTQSGSAFKLAQNDFIRYDTMWPDSKPFAHPIFWAPFTLWGQ